MQNFAHIYIHSVCICTNVYPLAKYGAIKDVECSAIWEGRHPCIYCVYNPQHSYPAPFTHSGERTHSAITSSAWKRTSLTAELNTWAVRAGTL